MDAMDEMGWSVGRVENESATASEWAAAMHTLSGTAGRLGHEPAQRSVDGRGRLGVARKGASIYYVRKNFGILDPLPPLVRILARSIRVNPRNLPYYVCFWATPLPLPVRTSFMYGP